MYVIEICGELTEMMNEKTQKNACYILKMN